MQKKNIYYIRILWLNLNIYIVLRDLEENEVPNLVGLGIIINNNEKVNGKIIKIINSY